MSLEVFAGHRARTPDVYNLVQSTAVQVRRHFHQGEFPSSHHREEGWPSDQENTAQHPLFARTGWCSDRTDKEHHPGGVNKEASRHFLGNAATPPRGNARRGIRFFQNETSKPHMFSWPLHGYPSRGEYTALKQHRPHRRRVIEA